MRTLVDRIVGVCFSLLWAAIAVSVAASLIRPYVVPLVIGGSVVGLVAGWRAWQRNRW